MFISKVLSKKTFLFFFILTTSGCTYGWLYNNTIEPYCTNMKGTPKGELTSRSSLKQVSVPRVFGLKAVWDDNTITDSAKKAGITEVYYCDRKLFRILGGVWQDDSIIVYGK